ncbi:MAG: NADH-quinone oxidoreductase subunit L [Candidatus Limnocylindrales bacterium]
MNALLLPLLPLVGAGLVLLAQGRPRLGGAVAVASLVASLLAGVWAAIAGAGMTVAWGLVIELVLRVDGFGRVMVILVPFIAAPIVAYAAASEADGRTGLLVLMLAFVAAMLLLVVAADFVSLLIGWELIGAVSWALIGHGWRDRANVEAGTQAFLTTRLGDLGLYVAAGAAFAASGSFGFDALGSAASPWREIVAGGVLLAAAAKSAQVPFSPWLFAAMAGPTPVSALLHSAPRVAAGAYLLIRLAPALAPVAWFLPLVAIVGIVTALGGGVVAALQTHMKRALAASTSAQFGLMFVAIGAGSTAAAAAQLVTHAVFKSLLFLAIGVAIHATGSAVLGGSRLGRRLPLVAAAAGVGSLALAGVPPLGGAWIKEAILGSALEKSVGLGLATLLAGFLTAVYAGRLQVLAFGRGEEPSRRTRRPSAPERGALATLAIASLALGVLWLPGASATVEGLSGSRLPGWMPWEIAIGLAAVAAGGLVVVALERRGRLLDLGLGQSFREGAADWLLLPRVSSALVVRPTLRLSLALARADDRVIDAGVRFAARTARLVSALVGRRVEFSIDGLVQRVAGAAVRVAAVSRIADDAGLDRAVQATGRGIGVAGQQSRRLQTGLTHHYFVIIAVGLGLIVVVLTATR